LGSNPEPKLAIAVTSWRIEMWSDSAFPQITLDSIYNSLRSACL